MRFLLDTNVLSEVMRLEPDTGVLSWLEHISEREIALSVVTLGEIEYGLLKLGLTRRAADLRNRLDAFLGAAPSVLDADRQTMLTWARLTTETEAQGRPPGVMDTLLAATCVHHGLTLVTRNTRHFEVFGVPLLNPWTA